MRTYQAWVGIGVIAAILLATEHKTLSLIIQTRLAQEAKEKKWRMCKNWTRFEVAEKFSYKFLQVKCHGATSAPRFQQEPLWDVRGNLEAFIDTCLQPSWKPLHQHIYISMYAAETITMTPKDIDAPQVAECKKLLTILGRVRTDENEQDELPYWTV